MGASESEPTGGSAEDGEETAMPGDQSTDEPEPTAQPTALRRQQQYAAAGGSLLAGLAVTVSILQRFPDLTAIAVLAGVASAFLVYRLARNSIFPGEGS